MRIDGGFSDAIWFSELSEERHQDTYQGYSINVIVYITTGPEQPFQREWLYQKLKLMHANYASHIMVRSNGITYQVNLDMLNQNKLSLQITERLLNDNPTYVHMK